ncbi:chymotrypsinogen A-like isoform X2 [Daphnia pulex]|uniref:chymotrypsinogen A-like isoform X2 n=1 Tax=Daphnia pulex TaxID=6669 RepID=UPI001EDCB955|nr:chymotrypsinogen A-like isoform X2 [Daphnia pulex]
MKSQESHSTTGRWLSSTQFNDSTRGRCFLRLLSVLTPAIKREAQLQRESQVSSKSKQHDPLQQSRRMLGHQKGLSAAFVSLAIVTLLSCCCSPASSFAFLPRVSRTKDAVVIDFAGVGYAPSNHGKSLYGEITNPAFVPVPSVYPYPMMYRQQEQRPNGWSYSFGYPVDSSGRQAAVGIASAATTTTTPAPGIQCGKGPTALPARSLTAGERIVSSSAPASGSHSWMFLVTLRTFDADPGVFFCSGTLISDSKVLLAASCLEDMSLFELSGVTVLIGLSPSTDAANPAPNVQMTRRINKMVLHNQYNAFTYANDIAILTLDAPIALTKFIVPVCLPPANADPDQYVDQSAVIVGWGTAFTAPPTPSTALNQGTVSVLSNADCKLEANFGKYVSTANICISSTTNYICPGDIGGPVLVLTSPGVWTQIGINSYSSNDCTTNSLQTRVSAFRPWIDTYLAN